MGNKVVKTGRGQILRHLEDILWNLGFIQGMRQSVKDFRGDDIPHLHFGKIMRTMSHII